MKEFKTIKIEERRDGISIITLNRPERLNAINFEMMEELLDYITLLENNFEIRVVILTGEGRAFSAGLDLKDSRVVIMRKVPEEFQRFKHLLAKDKTKRMIMGQKIMSEIIIKLRRIPQPIISAVKGAAHGAAFGLALASDIRIAGESAYFCNAFIKIGVSGADCGSSYWLPRLIGYSRAAEIIYTGKNVEAKEADRIGLVSKVVPDDEVLDESIKIAKEMLNKSPMGIRFTKDTLNMNIDAPSFESAIKLENRTQVVLLNTNDAMEGMFSFLEKRDPKYDKW